MKGIIVYTGRYGTTAQYAGWLSEDTGYPAVRLGDVRMTDLEDADIVIIGTSVRIGRMEASKWLARHADMLSSRRIAVFSVALTPRENVEEIDRIVERSIPVSLGEGVRYFALPGRIRPDSLSFLDRQMLKMAAKEEKDPEALARLSGAVDRVSRDEISPVLEAVRQMEAEG